jgi:O-antigen chain-terminating methyltransferase
LPDRSLGVVTAFHLIEHLSFERLMELLGETHRVLATGGLAIFETPNPESVYVVSETFLTDPTHVRPLPPSLIKFLLQHVGFAKTELLRLHKRCEPDYTGQKHVDEMIWRLTMEQDYAMIGSK